MIIMHIVCHMFHRNTVLWHCPIMIHVYPRRNFIKPVWFMILIHGPGSLIANGCYDLVEPQSCVPTPIFNECWRVPNLGSNGPSANSCWGMQVPSPFEVYLSSFLLYPSCFTNIFGWCARETRVRAVWGATLALDRMSPWWRLGGALYDSYCSNMRSSYVVIVQRAPQWVSCWGVLVPSPLGGLVFHFLWFNLGIAGHWRWEWPLRWDGPPNSGPPWQCPNELAPGPTSVDTLCALRSWRNEMSLSHHFIISPPCIKTMKYCGGVFCGGRAQHCLVCGMIHLTLPNSHIFGNKLCLLNQVGIMRYVYLSTCHRLALSRYGWTCW